MAGCISCQVKADLLAGRLTIFPVVPNASQKSAASRRNSVQLNCFYPSIETQAE